MHIKTPDEDRRTPISESDDALVICHVSITVCGEKSKQLLAVPQWLDINPALHCHFCIQFITTYILTVEVYNIMIIV